MARPNIISQAIDLADYIDWNAIQMLVTVQAELIPNRPFPQWSNHYDVETIGDNLEAVIEAAQFELGHQMRTEFYRRKKRIEWDEQVEESMAA